MDEATKQRVEKELRSQRRTTALLIAGALGLTGVMAYGYYSNRKEAEGGAASSSADTAPAVNVRTENGVKVAPAPHPVWCTERGNCFPDGAQCSAQKRGGCTLFENYSCMTFIARTDGAKILECWRTYGECKERERVIRTNDELESIETPCFILRKGG